MTSPTKHRIKTSKEQILDAQLTAKGRPVTVEFVRERRPNTSWPDITFEIRTITGTVVTEAAIRRWFSGIID